MLQLTTEGAGKTLAQHITDGLGEHIHIGKIEGVEDPDIKTTMEEKNLKG